MQRLASRAASFSLLAVLAAAPACSVSRGSAVSGSSLEFPVSGEAGPAERRIADHLVLRILRWPNRDGTAAGWEVSVEDDRPRASSNLLYHSRIWHGPYPTQMTPESLQSGQFGAVRRLPVRGRPWEVEIVCENCESARDGDDTRFTGGTVRMVWRRR
jgi:hypothetical protein